MVLSRASVLDPREGIDGVYDVVVRDGQIAELASPGEAHVDDAEVVDAEGKHLFPAFFDPHVHLRDPGGEDAEDIETGSRAAAAGGYCGILAMANTKPPIDQAADITALRERAATDASVPVGFLATVTMGMAGAELTEMAELRDAGAAGFSDDGLPLRSARVMRRALSYQPVSSGYFPDPLRPTYAIRPGATGDISLKGEARTNSFVVWSHPTLASAYPSPLVVGDQVYTLMDRGFLTSNDAKTGKEIYGRQRIANDAGTFSASPWSYNGKIFAVSEDGDTFVMQAGPEFKVLARNSLGEMTLASPAVANGSLYLRTATKLYRVTRK